MVTACKNSESVAFPEIQASEISLHCLEDLWLALGRPVVKLASICGHNPGPSHTCVAFRYLYLVNRRKSYWPPGDKQAALCDINDPDIGQRLRRRALEDRRHDVAHHPRAVA